MAGILGIYGMIVAVILSQKIKADDYSAFKGYSHLAAGLCCGLSSLVLFFYKGCRLGNRNCRRRWSQSKCLIGQDFRRHDFNFDFCWSSWIIWTHRRFDFVLMISILFNLLEFFNYFRVYDKTYYFYKNILIILNVLCLKYNFVNEIMKNNYI